MDRVAFLRKASKFVGQGGTARFRGMPREPKKLA
jgi:hypothetical protein